MNTLKAVYAGNYIRKEGEHKGETFHIYTIKGSTEDLKKFKDSPNQKKWPRTSTTGEPQMHTMYMDLLRDELPLYLKQDGNYTLDQSETRKDVARLGAMEKVSTVMASTFATRLADKVWGGKPSQAQVDAFITPTPAVDGQGADLGDVK